MKTFIVACPTCGVIWDLDYDPPQCEDTEHYHSLTVLNTVKSQGNDQLTIIIPGEQDICPGPACYGEGDVCYLHTDEGESNAVEDHQEPGEVSGSEEGRGEGSGNPRDESTGD